MKTFNNKITLNLDGDAEVSVKGFIAPIEYSSYNFHVEWDTLANLRVAEHISIFQAFLPDEPVSVGECWQIEEAGVLELLRQLHTALNLNMDDDSGDSSGLWACLRAYNDRFADIAFRVHAEFKLEDGWLTPSQFAGNLIIDRLDRKITFFEMSVPAGTVESRYRLERRQRGILFYYTVQVFARKCNSVLGRRDVVQDIEFVAAITPERSRTRTDSSDISTKFRNINWVCRHIKQLEMAEAQQKLIHAISIDGPLADESC